MKRLILLLAIGGGLWAQTSTPNLNLNLPYTGEQGWGNLLNANAYKIDGLATGYQPGWEIWPLSAKGQIYGFGSGPCALPASSNGLVLTLDSAQPCGLRWTANTGTGTVTGPSSTISGDIATWNGSSGTALSDSLKSFQGTGNNVPLTTGSHTANNCAKWDASGNIVDAGAACGSGSGGGNVIYATASPFNLVCDGTTVNTATPFIALNNYLIANDNTTVIFPSYSTCLLNGLGANPLVGPDWLIGTHNVSLVGNHTVIRNTQNDGANTLNFSAGGSEFVCLSGTIDNPTANYDYTAAPIATVSAGSSTITALTPANVSTWQVGDSLLIYGYDQQGSGFPPNYRYFDRAQIQAINTGTGVITLGGGLEFGYNQNWYYAGSGDNTTAPAARNLTRTCTGGGNVKRMGTLYISGMDFSQAPTGQLPTAQLGGADTIIVENSQLGYAYPTEAGTVIIRNSTVQLIEEDKLVTNFITNNVTCTGNVQTPSDPCWVSGSGVRNEIRQNDTFLAGVDATPQVLTDYGSQYYSNSGASYGWFANTNTYAQSASYNNNPLWENGASQAGVYNAAGGYNVTVTGLSGSSFSVGSGDVTRTIQLAGPGTQIIDHSTGAIVATVAGNPYLSGSTLYVPTSGPVTGVSLGTPPGSGYVVNDIVSITQAGCNGAQAQVTAVTAGVPTAVALWAAGNACQTGTNLATTGGTGAGLHVNITSTSGNVTNGEAIDLNPNPVNVTINYPVAMDWDTSSVIPVFTSSSHGSISNLTFNYSGVTTVKKLPPATGVANKGVNYSVRDASSVTSLGSGGGTTYTPTYYNGSQWLPISGGGQVPLNVLTPATGTTSWSMSTYGLTLSGTQLSSTAGNGATANGIGITATKGQNTTSATGNQAGSGGGFVLNCGDGGNAPAGGVVGYGGACVINGGKQGTGGGTTATDGEVLINNNVSNFVQMVAGTSTGWLSVGNTPNTSFNKIEAEGNILADNGSLLTNVGVINSGVVDSGLYGTLASAGTVAPTHIFNQLTGSTTISVIMPMSGCGTSTQNCKIYFRGPFTLSTGGNIALPATPFVAATAQDVQLDYNPGSLYWSCVGCITPGSGSGTVTSFAAPSGSWPSWLVPTVSTATTTPSLAVAAGNIPVTALNGGTSASSSTFWRGDGTWATPASGGFSPSPSATDNTILFGLASGYGFGTVGSSGALCIGTACSGGTDGTIDIVTSVVPRVAAANTWTGAQDFTGSSFIKIKVGSTAPPCAATGDEGSMWLDTTTATANHLKVCAEVSSTIGFQTIF